MHKSVVLFVLCTCLAEGFSSAVKEPVYNRNFRYEESMKTSASEIPHGGYSVYEGSYYPRYTSGYRGGSGNGYEGGYGGYGPWNPSFYPVYKNSYVGSPNVGGGFGGGYISGGSAGAGVSGGAGFGGWYPHAGGYTDKKFYDSENKKAGGEGFHKSEGSKGESGQHGSEGFTEGQVAVKDVKGDSGYYKGEGGDKKVVSDGKTYNGGQHYNEEGKQIFMANCIAPALNCSTTRNYTKIFTKQTIH